MAKDLTANLILRIRQLGVDQLREVGRAMDSIAGKAPAVKQAFDFDLGAKAGQAAEAMSHAREKLKGLIDEPLDKFKDFELTMARVKGHMNHLSEKDFAALTAAAKQAGLTTFFSSQQAAEGLEAFAMQGLSAKQQMDALTPTMALAQAGHVDLAESARVTIETMHQFGLKSEDTQHITDVLARTFTSASTDGLHGLSEAFKYVGPNAHAAGLTLEQTAVFAGLLGNSGLTASIAGTTLTAVISRLAYVTPRAKKALAETGYSAQKMAKDLQHGGPSAVLAELEKHMEAKHMNKWQRMSVLIRLFGSEAAKGVQTLMEKSSQVGPDGKTGFEHLTEEIEHADGQTKKFSDSLSKTTAGQLQMAQNQIEALKLQLGEGFAPAAIKAANAAKPFVGAMIDYAKAHPDVTAGLATTATGLIAILGPLTAAAFSVSTLATGFATLKPAMAAVNAFAAESSFLSSATAAGSTFAGTFMAALAAGIAGYSLTTALLSALDIDMSQVGAKIYDMIHGETPKANERGIGHQSVRAAIAKQKAESAPTHPMPYVPMSQQNDFALDLSGKPAQIAMPDSQQVSGSIEVKVTDDRVRVNSRSSGPVRLRTGATPVGAR